MTTTTRVAPSVAFDQADEQFMQQALALAEQGLFSTDPNPRVGCVLVKHGQIIGSGAHRRAGEAHAEVHALHQAGSQARGAHAYVTLEPCCHHGRTGPCASALIEAGISAVTYALDDADPKVTGAGASMLRDAGIEVRSGLLASQAQYLNRGFFSRHQRARPWVRLKLAISLDGKIAAADGSSQWITGSQARADNQYWRARASAIMTGSGTLLTDDPRLNVRLPVGAGPEPAVEPAADTAMRQPLRVVLSSAYRLNVHAKMLQLPGPILVIGCTDPQPAMAAHTQAVQIARVAAAQSSPGVDLAQAMRLLASLQVNELQVECGPTLAGSLMAAGLVDELLIYQADCLLGERGRSMLDLPGLNNIKQRLQLPAPQQRQFGRDRRLLYTLTHL